MAQTLIHTDGIADGAITRTKLNTTTAASAVITKALFSGGVLLKVASTGIDSGTGDVTFTANQFIQTIGDGTTNPIVIAHGLLSQTVMFSVWENVSPFREVVCDITHDNNGQCTLSFATPPAAAAYKLLAVGY